MIIGRIKQLEAVEGEKHLSSVKSNIIDKEIFEEALKDASAVNEKIMERNAEAPFFKKLSEDLFNGFYKIGPQVYHKSNVVSSLDMEHDLVAELTSNEKFNHLRANTAGDVFNSTFSLNMFQEEAYKKYQEWVQQSKENEELMNDINDAISKQEDLRQLLEDLNDEPDNQDIQDKIEQLENMLAQANKDIADKQNKMSKDGKGDMGSLKSALTSAMETAQEQTEQMADVVDNFFGDVGTGAGDGQGVLSKVPYEDRLKLAEQLMNNSKLKEIAKILGRMKEMLNSISKKPSKYGSSITDVGTGDNIRKSLSSEKLLLTDNELENQFYKKYFNKSLLQYQTAGTQEQKGPVIVCLDGSGSMSGQRDYWAKSIAIAMLQLALKDKREFRCIIFSNKVNAIFDFNRETFTTEKLIEMATYFASGGTSFEPALQRAVESIEESSYRKADILFITDGSPNGFLTSVFKSKFKALKEDKDFAVQGIIIGSESTRYLEEFCDDITTFRDLNKDNELVNIFSNVKERDR